ncbi:MAG: hypothetical protein U1F46_11045 [Marinagarivorans sp.]
MLSALNINLVPFTVSKVAESYCVWDADTQPNSIHPEPDYAYVISACPTFTALDINNDDQREFLAERYGGNGVGVNGGGARCGNFDGLQYKGIGANCMVGQSDDYEHTYGGLDARKAIAEAIYSSVLNEILPHGTVKVHRLIYLGEKTAFDGIGPCWGIILVRDIATRPAHFLRAKGFAPLEEHKKSLPSDLHRIRILYKSLSMELGSPQEFIKILLTFLDRSANQFSFSAAMRISHNTLSPSNLALDGRWLDLPVTSFLRGGKNYCIWQPFYQEKNKPLEYAIELAYEYSKYTSSLINPKKLREYYNAQFERYFTLNAGYIFGIDAGYLPQLQSDKDWMAVANHFKSAIYADPIIDSNRPEPYVDDPIHSLIIDLFLSAKNLPTQLDTGIAKAFKGSIERYIKSKQMLHGDETANTIFIATALKALKRAFFSEAYFLTAIDKQVLTLCNTGSPYQIRSFINNYTDAGKWIFSEDPNSVTLFNHAHLIIQYTQGRYTITDEQVTESATCFEELYAALEQLTESRLCINSFSLKPFFIQMNQVLKKLEAQPF